MGFWTNLQMPKQHTHAPTSQNIRSAMPRKIVETKALTPRYASALAEPLSASTFVLKHNIVSSERVIL
jgi:hypothetical protein